MKTGIVGAVALALGIWSLTYCWWFAVEVFQGLIALALIIGGGLIMAIAIRRICRDKQAAKQ
jgi:hypothetical protein